MEFTFSQLGDRLTQGSGIEQLMDDLGHALAAGGDDVCMLGGGNPAKIPQLQQLWRDEFAKLLRDMPDRFDRMLLNYDPCQGNRRFLEAVAALFRDSFGWNIRAENVAVTNGGQTAFFYLLNMFGGRFATGEHRKILLPIAPEYIGYADLGVGADCFRALRPAIELLDETTFKYRVDFDALESGCDDCGAICVSRPTNPSGNLLTDAEVERLAKWARRCEVPLIIDNAYGAPLPNIVFRDVSPIWYENAIYTFSLSKLGLPGTRTGIVIGPRSVVRAVSSMNAIVGLASGNVGQVLVTELLEKGLLAPLGEKLVRPFYEAKANQAIEWLHAYLPSGAWRMHRSEGALFLWLWFPQLAISSRQLYERLKEKGVIVVPGEYFFFGLEEHWEHSTQCIRLSFAMEAEEVKEGIRRLGDTLKEIQSERQAASC